MESLEAEAQRLLEASLAKSSLITYKRGINDFQVFRDKLGLGADWPAQSQHIVAYIAQLSIEGKAPSTIETHVAALAYIHKINGWGDPTDNFVIRKLKEGCRRQNRQADIRRPITLTILSQLVGSLPVLCSSSYEACLFKAAFTMAFFGFLRVGEFTTVSKQGSWDNILSPSDVIISGKPAIIEMNIRSSKTDQRGVGTTLQIEQGPNLDVCPVVALSSYLRIRPSRDGPLFIHFGGDPLTRYQFSILLKKGVKAVGLLPAEFSPHSFRIGAATTAAMSGLPMDKIMEMGRWRSSAMKLYIRPSRVVSPKSWVL